MLSLSALITLGILASAIVLLIFTRLRADLIGLMILLALGLSNVVDNKEVFSGFSNTAVMTILGISMVSVALQQTGATNALGKVIFRVGKGSETKLIFYVMLASAVLSLFMNNIAAVGVLLPAVMSLSRVSQVSPRKLLMPLAFGTILGGMATLLTTSNIIVSSALRDEGLESFGLLDFFPIGAPVAVVGILYMLFLGRRILGEKSANPSEKLHDATSSDLTQVYSLHGHLKKVMVQPGSLFAGRTLRESGLVKSGINVFVKVIAGNNISCPPPDLVINAGDQLIIFCENTECDLVNIGLKIMDDAVTEDFLLDNGYSLSEFVIAPHSTMVGKSLTELQFRSQFEVNVMAFWREGKPVATNLGSLALRFGDALLVLGSVEQIRRMQKQKDFILTEEDPDAITRPGKRILALVITLLTLGAAALDLLPVAQLVILGAVLLILTGCMSINDAYQAIEWKAIFLIAGMWPLSIAIQETGLASALIDPILRLTGQIHPIAIIAIFLLLALILTQLMSGQVSAIVLIPLALTAARTLNVHPQALAMAVALGCSLAFLTPMGHPVNIMVMNPGGYSFKDYLKVGAPLTALAFITILLGIYFYYGL
jgi:di/tricarboxylate transporter